MLYLKEIDNYKLIEEISKKGEIVTHLGVDKRNDNLV